MIGSLAPLTLKYSVMTVLPKRRIPSTEDLNEFLQIKVIGGYKVHLPYIC